MHVSRVNPSITERLRELPNVGKVNTKYKGGFAIICIARMRPCSGKSREFRVPDLSSQVCTTIEFNASVLMTAARLVGL